MLTSDITGNSTSRLLQFATWISSDEGIMTFKTGIWLAGSTTTSCQSEAMLGKTSWLRWIFRGNLLSNQGPWLTRKKPKQLWITGFCTAKQPVTSGNPCTKGPGEIMRKCALIITLLWVMMYVTSEIFSAYQHKRGNYNQINPLAASEIALR